MNFMDMANLLDSDGNMQNEMMVMAFAATLLSTIPVLLGNEFDINVGLKKKKRRKRDNFIADKWEEVGFYLRTLPKIFEKVQSRDPAFLSSLKDEQVKMDFFDLDNFLDNNGKMQNSINDKWRDVGYYFKTLPRIIKKVQRRDPEFLRSLEDEQVEV